MENDYEVFIRLAIKLVIVAGVLYSVYRQKKKNKALLGQAAQELKGNLDSKFMGKTQFVFAGPGGESCQVWVTEKRSSQPARLYVQVDRSPQFKFNLKTKRSFWKRGFTDVIPRGQVVPLGVEIDSLAKFRAHDPTQAQYHFMESKRRLAMAYLLQAGFNTITADGTKMVAVKDGFTPVDLGPANLQSYANALCSLA